MSPACSTPSVVTVSSSSAVARSSSPNYEIYLDFHVTCDACFFEVKMYSIICCLSFPFLQTFRRLFAELSCASPRRRRVLPRVRPPHCRMLNRSASVSPAVIHFSFFPTIMFHIITRNSDQSNICITLSIIIFSGFPSEILNPR